MSKFSDIIESPPNTKLILQGNAAFALGVIHSGIHAVTGYPGTPSTEVIDKSLAFAQDRIIIGWSVNEAVAVSTGLGHAVAGFDAVVTMKVPGVFQAADAITTTAFYTGKAGALVLYVATDYVPSSTQHVIDARYFFSSTRLPVLEPRNHQEMYDINWVAADLSREFNTPVVVLASGILAHSEALIKTRQPRTITPRELPDNLHDWMNMPSIARANYNKVTLNRIPGIKQWAETSDLIGETEGKDDWGVIVNGEAEIVVREALKNAGLDPSILSLAITYPLPETRVKSFADKIRGKIFVIEDGHRFLEEKVRLLGINAVGKDDLSVITNWTPEDVMQFLSQHMKLDSQIESINMPIQPLPRPPSICPGCSYKALTVAVSKLKRRGKLYAAFGDIGCSTLLHYLNSLDTCSCMGASDSIRQGFVLSRPDMVDKVVSIIGDSTECHSGLDSTRNAVFRNVPGVKIILDNSTTAMTGGQAAPSSNLNLEGQPHKFNLRRAIEAEGGKMVVVDAFDLTNVEKELKKALKLAKEGVFTTLLIEGDCIHECSSAKLMRTVEIDYDLCTDCGVCDICPGLVLDENKHPTFTSLCTNCASTDQICRQICPFDAIVQMESQTELSGDMPQLSKIQEIESVEVDSALLPDSLRVAIRGIGGQGNLFFGKVLSEVAMLTPYADAHIVKGDTHGMAQLGGSVISTFSCGDVYSPALAPHSVDALVAMEISELLRPGFIELLKPGGTIIFNEFTALPVTASKEDYPSIEQIKDVVRDYNVLHIDANRIAFDLGDKAGRTANVVVIGLLSTVKPFANIPESVWQRALLKISPNEVTKSVNLMAFAKGRSRAGNAIDSPVDLDSRLDERR